MSGGKKKGLTASTLRILLGIALFLLAAGAIAIFLLGHSYLSEQADEVSQARAEAEASSDALNQVQALERELNELSTMPELLDDLTVASELPQFTAVQALRDISSRHGISIESFNFGNTEEAASSSTTGDGAAAATTGQNGVQIYFNAGTVSYQQLISFLNDVEQNTPKLQIESISLPQGSTRSSIELGQLTLTLYTR